MSAPEPTTVRGPVIGINFGNAYASIAVVNKVGVISIDAIPTSCLLVGRKNAQLTLVSQEGHAECIANEDGERQIAAAVSYNGEEVVSQDFTHSDRPSLMVSCCSTSEMVLFPNLLRIQKTLLLDSEICWAKSGSILPIQTSFETHLLLKCPPTLDSLRWTLQPSTLRPTLLP